MNRINLRLVQARFLRTRASKKLAAPSIDEQLAGFDEQTRKQAKEGLAEHVRTNGKSAVVNLSKLSEVALLQKLNNVQNSDLLESDSEFWNMCKLFCKQVDAKEHVSTLASLFQAAKNMKNNKLKTEFIHLIGRTLYAPRIIRLDPVNEVEYLDALCMNRRVYTALKLWKSRLGRPDVEPFKWYWLEVGVLYYLQANLYLPAARLAAQIPAKHNYMPPRVLTGLISFQCLSKFPNLRAIEALVEKLTSEFSATSEKHTLQTHGSSLTVNKLKPGRQEYVFVLKSLIAANLWPLAAKVYTRCLQRGVHPKITELEQELTVSAGKAKSNDGFIEFYDLLEDKLAAEPVVTGRLLLAIAKDTDVSAVPGLYEKLSSIPSAFLPAITLCISKYVGPGLWPLDATVLGTVLRAKSIPRTKKQEYTSLYLSKYRVENVSSRDFGLLVSKNYISLEQAAEFAGKNTQFWKHVWYNALKTKDTGVLPSLFRKIQHSSPLITPQLALYLIYTMQRVNEGKQALLFATEHGFVMSKLQFHQLKKRAELSAPLPEPDLTPPKQDRRVSLRKVERFLDINGV